MTLTDQQKAILRQRYAEFRRAQLALREAMVMLDPRLADPASGVTLDTRTMEIVEPKACQEPLE